MPPNVTRHAGLGMAVTLFGVLAVLRLLAADFGYFFEQDEMSLANGIAALMSGETGYLYHYAPQVGYYRLVQAFASLGGGVDAVPLVMSGSAALAGAAIPAASLLAFKNELSATTRWLVAAIVACSPVVWMSSQYGNSAILSTAAGVIGLVVLSNRPGLGGIVLGLALTAVAVLIRADAVLLAPVVVYLVARASGDTKSTLQRLAVGAIAFVAAFALIALVDPEMGGASTDVAEHFGDTDLRSFFWEHLIWAVSPFVLGSAVLGAKSAADRERGVFWATLLWIIPICAFYFGSTTTPRYFLQAVVPISILAALGLRWLATDSARPRLVWGAGLAALFVHMFVGLGHFFPSDRSTLFTAPSYDTDDGPMPTGALLYQGFHRGLGVFGSSLRAGPWGSRAFLAQAIEPELERLAADGPDAPESVLAIFTDWNGHVMHYHTFAAGGRIEAYTPGIEFLAPTVYTVGGTSLTVVGLPRGVLEASELPRLGAGDEVWYVSPREPFPRDLVSRGLPANVEVGDALGPEDGAVVVYPVVEMNQ